MPTFKKTWTPTMWNTIELSDDLDVQRMPVGTAGGIHVTYRFENKNES